MKRQPKEHDCFARYFLSDVVLDTKDPQKKDPATSVLFCLDSRQIYSSSLLHPAIDVDHIRFDVVCPALSSPTAEENLVGTLSLRVMSRLADLEWREAQLYYQDDYRLAWLTVLRAAEGYPDPWAYSFWMYYGRHPKKLIPFFVEREAKWKAMGPSLADECSANDFAVPDTTANSGQEHPRTNPYTPAPDTFTSKLLTERRDDIPPTEKMPLADRCEGLLPKRRAHMDAGPALPPKKPSQSARIETKTKGRKRK
jgi:hypothetical protein